MSVNNETTSPTPKINIIVPPAEPLPRWSGLKFECKGCPAEWQIHLGDKVRGSDGADAVSVECPWCGTATVVDIPAEAAC
jgi:hypothetical protein